MKYSTDKELQEAAGRFAAQAAQLARARASRRRVMTGAAVLAAGGIAAACSGSSKSTTGGTTAQRATSGSPVPSSGGAPSLSGTPVVTRATPSGPGAGALPAYGGSASVPSALARYPLVAKYNWRKLDWGGKPYVGGTLQVAGYPPPDYNLMTTETLTQFPIYMNALFYPPIHYGNNLDTGTVEPDLVQRAEHTPDYMSWTFTLPQNVYFQDLPPVNGAQMTSADVKFSFERYIDTSLWNLPLANVDHIEAPDQYTVKFVMKHPTLRLPDILALPYYQIFNPAHFADKTRFSQQPIGTGAFILKSSEALSKSEAVRNPKYWGKSWWLPNYGTQGLPFVDDFKVTYFSDPASLDAGLRGQSVDAADLGGALPSRIDDLLKANPKLKVTTQAEWAVTPTRVTWNWKNNPVFADVRVRQALSMALDRQNIVNVAFGGAGVVGTSPVPYDQLGLDGPPTLDDLGPNFKYDPAGAKQLLAQAGHPNGFSLTALDPAASPAAWATLVQKYWKDIGVTLNIQTTPSVQVTAALVKKDFDIIMSAGNVLGFNLEQAVLPLFYPDSPQNWGNVNDPEMTAVLDKLRASTNPDEWVDLAKQVFQVFNRNVDQLYVCGYHTFYATQPWVHTLAVTYYTTVGNYSSANWRNVWLDDSAPNGRGGKAVQ
jgi:peptide/nickel transport system substrate-binding protein